MVAEIEVTQAEIDGVAAVFDEVADDEVARSSAYIMTKKFKRVFAESYQLGVEAIMPNCDMNGEYGVRFNRQLTASEFARFRDAVESVSK